MDSLDQGEKEGEVNGSGDSLAVLEVEVCEVRNEVSDRALWGEELGLRRHGEHDLRRSNRNRGEAQSQRGRRNLGIKTIWRVEMSLSMGI